MADSSNKYSYLNHMPIEQLEKLLELAVDPLADEEDSEYVDAIMEVIVQKEKDHPTGRLSDVDEAWIEFQTYYNTEEGKGQSLYYVGEQDLNQLRTDGTSLSVFLPKRKRVRRIMLVAALIVLLIAMTAIPVFGYPNFIHMVAHWTAEQFSFRQIGSSTEAAKNSLPDEVFEEYEELLDTFQQRNWIGLAVPHYIPDGFQVVDSELCISPSSEEAEFYSLYQKDNDNIGFTLKKKNYSPTAIFEKDDGPVETYHSSGHDIYIFSNNGDHVAVWYTDGTQYSIGTTLSVETLKKIIHSMYEE